MTEVREGRPQDAATIVDFQVRMARETEEFELDRDICSKGVAAVFNNPSLGRYYVVEKDGAILASLMITLEWSDWRNGYVWWIQSVFVVPEARGRGLYRALYEHIKEKVNESDSVRGVRLYVDLTNENAQQVYSKLGMNGDHYKLFEWMQ